MSEDIIFPAIVTKVNEDETIELQVFGTKHDPNRYNVSQGSGVMMWDWMPFQKDQQKRVEAMADKIAEEKIQNEFIPAVGRPGGCDLMGVGFGETQVSPVAPPEIPADNR